MDVLSWRRSSFELTNDREKIDLDWLYKILADSYWAVGRTRQQVELSVANSLCFSLLTNNRQVGFGRVITDRAVFAYIADVVIAEEYRGQGLGKWMLECICAHPDLQSSKMLLETQDAHELYVRYGFQHVKAMKRLPVDGP